MEQKQKPIVQVIKKDTFAEVSVGAHVFISNENARGILQKTGQFSAIEQGVETVKINTDDFLNLIDCRDLLDVIAKKVLYSAGPATKVTDLITFMDKNEDKYYGITDIS